MEPYMELLWEHGLTSSLREQNCCPEDLHKLSTIYWVYGISRRPHMELFGKAIYESTGESRSGRILPHHIWSYLGSYLESHLGDCIWSYIWSYLGIRIWPINSPQMELYGAMYGAIWRHLGNHLGKPYMEPLRKSQNKNYKIFYFWVLLGRFLDTNLLFFSTYKWKATTLSLRRFP